MNTKELWNWGSKALLWISAGLNFYYYINTYIFHFPWECFPSSAMEMFAGLLYLNIKKGHETVGSLICLLHELPCTSLFVPPTIIPSRPMLSDLHLFLNGNSAFLNTIITFTYCFFSLFLLLFIRIIDWFSRSHILGLSSVSSIIFWQTSKFP